MGTTTVKRNGIFIILPAKKSVPIKGGEILPTVDPMKIKVKPMNRKPDYRRSNTPRRVPKKIGKRCWRCGEAVWRTDVNYCWDCYKYENFESK